MKIRTRFAPSPTGFLHVGSAYSALLDYAWAKKHQGKFVIRIEDTDVKRSIKGAEKKIYDGLRWMGLIPDESPEAGGPYGPYRQSERLSLYQKYARELVKKGNAYFCFCSSQRLEEARKDKQKKGLPPMYDQRCRDIDPKESEERANKEERHVIRMKVPENEKIVVPDPIRGDVVFESKVIDDQVLLKSDGYPTYHLAVVVDDHLMEITHAIRGEEWLSSAPKHFLLYRYFGWKSPVYLHTPTLRDESRKKLSKRTGGTTLDWYQEEGYLPEALINFLCLLGWSHPQEKDIFPLEEFIRHFDLQDLSPAGPVFDLKKLTWMNGAYIRKKTEKELVQLLKPFAPKGMDDDLIRKTVPLVKERMVILSDYPDLVNFLIEEPKVDIELLIKKGGGDMKLIKKQLSTVINQLSPASPSARRGQATIKKWQSQALEKLFRDLAAKNSWHVGKFFMATRIALTGKTVTPPLFESMELLGKIKTFNRIERIVQRLS